MEKIVYNSREIAIDNVEGIRGWMISSMTEIEQKIDLIIVNHFEPKKHQEFKKIILNSSIINFGAKLKILSNLPSLDNKTIALIRELSAIRNAFAHLPIFETITVYINEKHETTEIKIDTIIEVMNSEGKLKKKKMIDFPILMHALQYFPKRIIQYTPKSAWGFRRVGRSLKRRQPRR